MSPQSTLTPRSYFRSVVHIFKEGAQETELKRGAAPRYVALARALGGQLTEVLVGDDRNYAG